MKGLILKDLLLMKSNVRSLFVILVIALFLAMNDASSVLFMLPLFCITMCISNFSYDDYYKWDSYAIGMPIKKSEIVSSRYLSTLMVLILSGIVSFLLSLFVIKDVSLDVIVSNVLGGIAGVLIVVGVMFPILYKYGSEKGRIVFIAIIACLFGLFSLVFHDMVIKVPNVSDILLIGIISFVLLIVLFVSYFISKKVYLKKEF